MKKTLLLIALFAAVCAVQAKSPIDKYKAVFDKFPERIPNSLIPDAPVIGNGDIGVTVGTGPDSIRFYIGKNDFWRAIPSYPDGALALPGGLDMRCSLMSGAQYRAEQLPGTAAVDVTYSSKQGDLSIRSWVAATDDRLVVEMKATADAVVNVDLWAQQGGFSKTDKGPGWVTRSFIDIEHLIWPCHVALAMNVTSDTVQLHKDETRIITVAACSSFESDSWKQTAIDKAAAGNFDALWADHEKWWEDFWNLSHVTFSDPVLEKFYYLSQYIFACSSRENAFAPGLFGPFITTDTPAWAGDYHLNYNYQGPYWDSYSSNHICLTENYDQPLLETMDICREYSKKIHGTGGVLYPVGIGPHCLISSAWPLDTAHMHKRYGPDNKKDCGAMFWHQVTNASFAAANMLMRFYSTYDRQYAEKVYPFVLACGDFWEDYLTLKDGTYQVIPDIFYETNPFDDIGDSRNTVTSLGLVRMTMKGLLDMSSFLAVDADRHAKWQDIMDRLHPYPVADGVAMTGQGQFSIPVGPDSFRILCHGLVLPGCILGHDDPFTGVLLDMMAKWKETSIGQKYDWFRSLGNGIETSYPAAVRCGWPAADILDELRRRVEMQSYPNGWILQYGGGVETLSAVPMTINEMMLQSYEGYLRIFPNWDRTSDASFRTLRAYGAFLVSAAICSGNISDVTLTSEKGRDCTMENPWPGCQVLLQTAGRKPQKLSGDRFTFPTEAGATYTLSRISGK